MLKLLKNYLRRERGATAIVFALAIPVVMGAAGMAVDLSFGYLIKQRLSHALDSAAVAAAATTSNEAELEAKVNQFFKQNYPDDRVGEVGALKVTFNGSDVTVSATAKYNTMFATFLGIPEIDVSTSTTVTRKIVGLEVALVLDVTGSMGDRYPDENGNLVANIDSLKTASVKFIDILYQSAIYDDTVKVALVPYSTSVNVGPYGLGLDEDGNSYGTAFVTNTEGFYYYNPETNVNANTAKQQWRGCILEHEYTEDTEDSDTGWVWNPYRMTFRYSLDNFFRQSYTGCRTRNASGQCIEYYSRQWQRYDDEYGKNWSCNRAHIVPLTSDQEKLKHEISLFTPDGSTSGNIGMVWGYRVISPNFPFEEGVAFGDDKWRKAVVMMTDGDNTVSQYYTPYGGYTQSSVRSVTTMNERFAETCENMKDDGILIYTVTFTSNINDTTKQYYKDCATDPEKYYDAPTQSDLVRTFEAISRELSNIYIKN